MAHDPEWHREYYRHELAAETANNAYRSARRAYDRKPTASAKARLDETLTAMRETGKARWDFEMGSAVIVDIATLPAAEWARALLPAVMR